MPVSAGTVEGEPLLVASAYNGGLSAAETDRNIANGIDVQNHSPSLPVSKPVQEVQFSPRNMS